MRFGMLTYKIEYNAVKNKVCIYTTDIQPASIRCYTRDQILELIASADDDGRKDIYQAALEKFPKVKP